MKTQKSQQIGLFSRVSPEAKAMFEDIVYVLDVKNHEAMETIIRYYYENEKISPRPSRKRTTK
jgi:hypothetical protein